MKNPLLKYPLFYIFSGVVLVILVYSIVDFINYYKFTKDMESYVAQNIAPKIKNLKGYSLSGAKAQHLNLSLGDDFDRLSLQEKYLFLKPIMADYDDKRGNMIYDYKLNGDKTTMDEIILPDIIITTNKGKYEYSSTDSLTDPSGDLHLSTELDGTDEKIRQELDYKEKNIASLPPYDGMFESDISRSSWGPPTSIEYSQNYEAMRPDRRSKWYKWITKDSYGRIIEIKSLIVSEGFVLGEPSVSKYYQ
ncbi:hypothetical protein [Aneurinibacillus tyrosinisolvens]|uniref:hypothetical protein n=1 Tax=Aneurinibacillus tyrosinisolvens TaxID=1443435 RepID=UPI000B1188C1|nr:hypothetical protein [Aneurinibacillus tyrosinisolvens]